MATGHFRGGIHEPLTRTALIAKFRSNIAWGGLAQEAGERLLQFCLTLADVPDMHTLAQLRPSG